MNDKPPKKAPGTQQTFGHDPNLIVCVGVCQEEFQPSVPTYLRASLIMMWSPASDAHKEKYPLAQCGIHLPNGTYTLIDETPEELRQMMMGGH